MALTRKGLKAMGLTDEQVDSVIELHTETINGLTTQRDEYKVAADKLPGVQKELDDLKATEGGYKKKYEAEKTAFETFKSEQTAKETKAAKTTAVRKYFESKGITGKSLEIAMRGAGAEIDAAELDGEKLKDTAALDALVSGDFAGLVGKTITKGAKVDTPPANNSGAVKTRAEIAAMPDREARRAEYAKLINTENKGD